MQFVNKIDHFRSFNFPSFFPSRFSDRASRTKRKFISYSWEKYSPNHPPFISRVYRYLSYPCNVYNPSPPPPPSGKKTLYTSVFPYHPLLHRFLRFWIASRISCHWLDVPRSVRLYTVGRDRFRITHTRDSQSSPFSLLNFFKKNWILIGRHSSSSSLLFPLSFSSYYYYIFERSKSTSETNRSFFFFFWSFFFLFTDVAINFFWVEKNLLLRDKENEVLFLNWLEAGGLKGGFKLVWNWYEK